MTSNLLNYCIKQENVECLENPKVCSLAKIPRPPNAFMLYATENRKVMSHKYPADSNKVISKKLGSNWKSLDTEEKGKYFEKARLVAIEHKAKYPHYVYNPKEARIRKAMREAASRDRSIGASPMLPRPNARKIGSAWGTHTGTECRTAGSINPVSHGSHEEPLVMPNPLTQQLQQHSEMWHSYQEDLRTRSSGNSYMIQEIQSPYHQHQRSPPLNISNTMVIDQHRQASYPIQTINLINPISITPTYSNSIMAMTPKHSNENTLPDESLQLKENMSENGELKRSVDATQLVMENNVQFQNKYTNAPNRIISHQQFEQVEDNKAQKVPYCICQKDISCKNTLYLPLSCTDFCASPDLYTNNLEYQREYIAKYFHSLPEFEIHNLRAEDGICFPYASRINFCDDFNSIAEDCPQLSFLKTDVGFIPLTVDSNFSDYWSKFKR